MILNDCLQSWCDENLIIEENQAGFRATYSTIDHIFTLHAAFEKYICKRKGRFYCLFVDFSETLDIVQHVLLNSLIELGIYGFFFINIIASMYSKLSTCVHTVNGLSEYFKCNVGIRQGCTLCPQIKKNFNNVFILF